MPGPDATRPTKEARTTISRDRWGEVPELLASLYVIVDRLEELFPGRKFTPDGHLVGSIGEVIAARMFDLTLLKSSFPDHDAVTDDGRRVQIKLTQGTGRVALRAKPDYLLVLRLAPDRSIEVVYNGSGQQPWNRAGKIQKNGQRSISLSLLRCIDSAVEDANRITLCREINLVRSMKA